MESRERQWIEDLAVVERAHDAYARLKALPEQELRPFALQGLAHESWRVRRSCALLLDDLTLTDETVAALLRCLDDEHFKVRKAALHAVTCKHCKPDRCVVDVRPVFERMACDPDRIVRKTVATSLWDYEDEWALAVCRRLATSDPSTEVQAIAQRAVASAEHKQAAITALGVLPSDLRAKVERHHGKWVAVAEGRVVAADRSEGSVRRTVRGKRLRDAAVYCVP